MIKYKRKTRKAFSLIELLVAATIFALALIIAFGAFTLTLGNQSFVQANSEVNIDGDRIIRQLSDDIVNASGYGEIIVNPLTKYDKIKGFIFLGTDVDGNVTVAGSGIPSSDPASNICYMPGQGGCLTANTLALFYKNPDQIKIYQWSVSDNNLRSKTFAGSSISVQDIILSGADQINIQNVVINFFELTGATCTSVLCNQQPFVNINLDIRTRGYDSKAPAKRAKFIIQTRVESRIQ